MSNVACPYCEGGKKSYAFVDGHRADGTPFGDFREIDCATCKGTGEVDHRFAERHKLGRDVRDIRVAGAHTIRDAAFIRGMTTATYSRCEWGTPDSEEDWLKFIGVEEAHL